MTFIRVAVAVIALGVASVLAGCANDTDSSTTTTTATTETTVTPPTGTEATGTGLPYIPPLLPDAEGNPPCGVGIGWDLHTGPNGLRGTTVDIQKMWSFNDFVSLPGQFIVKVATKDGHNYTRDALVSEGSTDEWDSTIEKDFIFENVDPFDIEHVLVTSGKGTCWADGNPV